jgi:hypothetical protein
LGFDGKGEPGGHDADHDVSIAIQLECATGDIGIAAEILLPTLPTQDHRSPCAAAARFVIFRENV